MQSNRFVCLRITLLNYIFLFIEYLFMISQWNNANAYKDWTAACFPFIVLSIVLNVVLLRKKRIKFYDFRVAFMILTYVFMYGRILIIHSGKADILTWSLHKIVDQTSMFQASLFVICSTQTLFLGLMSGKECDYSDDNAENNLKLNYGALFSTGIFLLIIGIPCRLITDIYTYISTNLTGNYNNFQSATGLFDDFAFLLIPGLLCIMESRPKLKRSLIGITLAYFVIVMGLTGDRRYYTAGFIALALYYLCSTNYKIKPLKVILLGLGGLLFLNFLEVVQKMRQGGLTNLSTFFSTYGLEVLDLSNVVFDVFAEFGISFFSVVLILQYIPSELIGFQYGMTILKSIPTVLPIGFMLGNMISPSTVINDYTHLPVGGTLFGDCYADFGFLGFIAIFIAGIFLKKLFSVVHYSKGGLSIVLYYTCVSILINLVRCTVIEITRPLIWCTIIPLLFYRLISKRTYS